MGRWWLFSCVAYVDHTTQTQTVVLGTLVAVPIFAPRSILELDSDKEPEDSLFVWAAMAHPENILSEHSQFSSEVWDSH